MNKFLTKFCVLFLAFLLLPFYSFASSPHISEILGPGLIRKEYTYSIKDRKVLANVLECDLSNPSLKIAVVPGNGKYTQRATVSQMSNRTGSIAMSNGDFFNTLLQGTPEGPSIINGKLQSSPCVTTGVFSLGISNNNIASIEPIKFKGSITAKNGSKYPIDGLNKSYYWYEPTNDYSHEERIQLYNDLWASPSRGDKKNKEILVNSKGIIKKINPKGNFDFSVPKGGYILQASGKAFKFITSHFKVGDNINIKYSITPNKHWKFLVGGHALLLNEGQPVKYTKDIKYLGGIRARTAAGISKDGKKLYIVSIEGRTDRSIGLNLNELSNFMKSIGCYKALNLDGGGSTTMVIANLGDFKVKRIINPERNKAERKVVNGIGFYNVSPITGKIKGIKIEGPDSTTINNPVEFSIKAWDTNYHPINIKDSMYTLSDNSNSNTNWNEKTFLPKNTGKFIIIAKTQNGNIAKKEIIVTDPNQENPQNNNSLNTINKNSKELKLKINDLTYYLNNQPKKLDVAPLIKNNRTLVPVRFIVEAFNGKIHWDNNTRTISIKYENKDIKLTIGKNYLLLNNKKISLDSPAVIKNSRTLIPIRAIAEALDMNVNYADKTKVITIKSK